MIVPGYGAGSYKVAAADTKRRITQFTQAAGLNSGNASYSLNLFEPSSDETPDAESWKRGDWFFHKFTYWHQALAASDDQLFLHLDADASITSNFSAKALVSALGEKSIGMVHQTKVVGENPLGIEELFRHYLSVSSAAVNSGKPKPSKEDFKYFNTGFVLFRRSALESFLIWANEQLEGLPREVDGNMIADQDLIQVYANEIAPHEVSEFDWSWNHCEWWDEDFPNQAAKVVHMSNFCQGPIVAQMNRLAVLSRGLKAEVFKDLTVVMVTHNSSTVLKESLAALLEIPGLQIIIADNNSETTPATNLNPRIRVIANETNLGYARAVNAAIPNVTTKYICLLNPDAFLTYESTLEAIRKLRDNPDQLLAPNHFDGYGNFTPSCRDGYQLSRLIDDLFPNPDSLIRRVANRVLGSPEAGNFTWLIGACVFSSKDFLQNIGGLDERYFLYMEDVELGKRAQKTGSVASLESSILHLGAQSTSKPAAFIAKELSDARLKYLRRNFGYWPWMVAKALHSSSRLLEKTPRGR